MVFEAGAWEMQSVASDTATWQRGVEQVSVATWTVRVSRRAAAQSLGAAAVLAAGALLLGAAAALPPQQRAPLAACASFTAALWSAPCSTAQYSRVTAACNSVRSAAGWCRRWRGCRAGRARRARCGRCVRSACAAR